MKATDKVGGSLLDNMVEYVRTINGNVMVMKGGSGKRIIELLEENHPIGILSDQNVAAREGGLCLISLAALHVQVWGLPSWP